MTTCRKPETVQACFTPSNNSPSVAILHTTLFDDAGKAFAAYYHDDAGTVIDPTTFMGGGFAKIGDVGSILPKKQCWEVPEQVLTGTDAAPFVIVEGDLVIVSQGGQGNQLGPFVNTQGDLAFSTDGVTFDTWGNTVGGFGNQNVIDTDPLYIRNPATGTTVQFDITALTGGGSPTYAAIATIPAQSFNVTVYPDNTTVTCDSLGNEVTLPADAVQIECPSEFKALQEIRDIVSAIKFGGTQTCFEMPNDLGQNTAPNRFEDLNGAGANADITTNIELDIPEDGIIIGFALTLNSLTPAVPAPPTDTLISLLVNGVSTNTVSTLGGVFTHEFTLDAPVPVSQGELVTIQVVPEAGGIPSDILYLPANVTQNAFLQGSNVRPMLTVIAEGFLNFTKVTYADKTCQFFDGEGECIDELPAGAAECLNQEAQKLCDIDDKLAELIAQGNAKCATAQYTQKQLTNPNSLVSLFNFAANADDTIDNAVVTIADIEAFFDGFDYDATPVAMSTQGDFSIADFVGGAGTESNASFVEGYINVTGPMFIRMQNTNNWSGRVDLGENCGEYQNILTYYNGPGQSTTSPAAPIPLGLHRIRISSWDYDGSNGNINTQFSVTGTNGWTTNAAGIAGLAFSNVSPAERCFLGRVCEGSEDVTEVSTGLVVDGAALKDNSAAQAIVTTVGTINYCIADPNDATKTIQVLKRVLSDGTYGPRETLLSIDPDAVECC